MSKSGRFALVVITGDLRGVMNAINHFRDDHRENRYFIEKFNQDNEKFISPLEEKVSKL